MRHGQMQVGNVMMSLEDFLKNRCSWKDSLSKLSPKKTLSPEKDNHQTSTESFFSSSALRNVPIEWNDSKLYTKLKSFVSQGKVPGEKDYLELIHEADRENEEDSKQIQLGNSYAKGSLFQHYKQSRQIYSQVECEYHAEILKKKLNQSDQQIDEDHLFDIYFIALKTLGALMTLLLLKPQWLKLEAHYGNNQSCITPINTIKLLLRTKKMYEAHSQLLRIFKLMLRRDIIS